MLVNPINFTGAQAKKPLTNEQKIGIGVGTAVAVGAVATGVTAAVKGKKALPDAKFFGKEGQFKKGFALIGEGIKKGWGKVADTAKNLWGKFTGLFHKKA